eukprot:TRINITY_DN8646_c0_g6_i1.p1 TRINITY_DN8646_c0_g6~~TRINITY_DN8646_c0_g6_i1.p1  ORF type:complete len:740 (-),score=243.23 TRINITY_DN8646_c0_g6_i1:39-2195(-)
MKSGAVLGLAAQALLVSAREDGARAGAAGPVAKVVKLLTEMKTQVESEASEDKDAYEKYACWCTTNEKLKTDDVATAEKEISRLEVEIEEAVGLQGQLKTEIESLAEGIAEDQDALASATSAREKQSEAFQAESKEMTETIATLKQAIAVLAKVQGGAQPTQGEASMLLQLRGVIREVHAHVGQYRNVMQRDLWDVMDALDSAAASAGGGAFLPPSGRGRLAALAQRQGQLQPAGAAAGAQSYNARSSGILGSLQAMMDNFAKELGEAQRADASEAAAFEKLRKLKLAEISAASERKAAKEKLLADTAASAAQAKEDLEATMGALSADQQVLVTLGKNCKANEEGYADRSKSRSDELQALGEAIKILTEDDARDLFGKTLAFLQTNGEVSGAERQSQSQAVDKAMRRLLHVAQRHKNWALASLAVNVRLDAFTKVKEAMDKMVAELKAQRKSESEKHDTCEKEIDSAEDSIKVKGQEKDDLEGNKLGLENHIASLEADIDALNTDIADMKTSLKRVGEDRKAENLVFQQSVSDQRAAVNVLQKARARLSQFYAAKTSKSLLQATEPGSTVAPPPPKPKEYSKSAGAGGVLQLMDMVIQDAEKTETELVTTEQQAQKSYEGIVRDLNANIEANSKALVAKTESVEQAKGGLSETKASLIMNGEELDKLQGLEKSLHLDCDFLLKYYDTRQQALSEEISAIGEAKSILSGANFGTAEEAA